MSSSSPSRRTNNRMFIVVVAVVVAVGIAAIVAVATSKSETKTSVPQFGQPEVTGTALKALPTDINASDPAIGRQAPEVTGTDAENQPTSLPVGKPQVVIFAAHWCPHCNREIPIIVGLMNSGQVDDTDMTLILTGSDPAAPNWPPTTWARKTMDWRGRTLMDSQDVRIAKAYGVNGFPTMVFIDADGKVTRRFSGEIPAELFISAVKEAAAPTTSEGKTPAPPNPTADTSTTTLVQP